MTIRYWCYKCNKIVVDVEFNPKKASALAGWHTRKNNFTHIVSRCL